MENKRTLPAFASEAEEAQWWFDHREERDRELAAAIDSGAAKANYVKSLLHHKSESEIATTITLEAQDALQASRLAEHKGIEVKTYLSKLLHAALQNELQTLYPESEDAA